jgi:REP element-mobilizing transposase RayT
MARPLRVRVVYGWHHVFSRGLNRMVIYTDDRDREHFVELLAAAVGRYGLRLHAYALLDNHYHLLVQTPAANLSRAMQWLNLSYAAWFAARHGWQGPVFQRPYRDVPVENGALAYELSLYVHLNPLRIAQKNGSACVFFELEPTVLYRLAALPDEIADTLTPDTLLTDPLTGRQVPLKDLSTRALDRALDALEGKKDPDKPKPARSEDDPQGEPHRIGAANPPSQNGMGRNG